MKNLLPLLISLLIIGTACQPASKTVNITGKLSNSVAEQVKIYNSEVEIESKIANGVFTSTFDIEKPSYFNLRIGREITEFYVNPGQSLEINIDAENFDESISYTGKDASASNYLAAKFLKEETRSPSGPDLFKLDESAFLQQLMAFENEGLEFLETFDAETSLGKKFIEIEKVNIAYGPKNQMISYEPAHKFYSKNNEFKASENFNTQLAGIDMNNPDYLGAANYGRFITSYLSNKAYQLFTEDSKYSVLGNGGITKATLDLIKSKITDKTVGAFAIDQIIKQTLSYSSALTIMPFLDEIKNMTDNSKTYALIDKSMAEWGHLAKGEPAPDFDGNTVEGTPVKLSDLKGKNVYIDVWATWCGPCKAEQPALFALEEEYKDNKNLAFMGISIDSDKAAWDKMVVEKEMKGIQIFTDGAWKSTICNEYLIKGIPRFILIDKNGKIIDSDAPRPSSQAIKEILKGLAGEPLLSSL